GEGLIPNLAARVGKEALLPFTGEGARRADEGARAQRSVPLMLPGRPTAARFARALIRRFAPPSPASQAKGSFRAARQGPDGEVRLPLRRRRADKGGSGRRQGVGAGEGDAEAGAAGGDGNVFEVGAVGAAQFAGDVQAQARAVLGGGEERAEQLRQ